MGYLKEKSTMMIFEKFSRLKKNFRGREFWARGYYVKTVGRNEAKIKEYIKNQENAEMVQEKYELPEGDFF